jgi:anti-anti-sigma regulatory factor
MHKIQRVVESGTVTLLVIGRMDAEQLPDLQKLVSAERAGDILLDLTELTLVDSEVVRFLAQCETQGVRLANCPAYIREWMVRESGHL